MPATDIYLNSVIKQFRLYKKLAEKAIDQPDASQLFHAYNENSNSIAVIVKHMHGNMISRWTDFLSTDGEKPWRKRDDEFENDITSKDQLLHLWEEGWKCFFTAIDTLESLNLTGIIFIRGEAHSVMDAINRQLAHYSYHIGQIVFAAKQWKGTEWESLSIPKKKL